MFRETNYILKVMTVLAWAIFVVPALGHVPGRTVVVVRSETIAHNDKLFLGDIADISSGDLAVVESLHRISLGYSPEVGIVRQITRDKISLAIAAAGFSDSAVEIKSQPIIVVRRQSQTVDLNEVRKVVEQVVLTPLNARQISAQLIKLDLPSRIEVRTGSIGIKGSIGSLKNVFNPFPVSIEVLVDGRIARRLNVTAQVEASAAVVVANSDLSEKNRIRSADVRIETVRLDRDLSTYIFELSKLRGVVLTRTIANGQAITTDGLVPDLVVKPGDVVKIVADSGRFNISLIGEARASGHVGDRIQVKNLQSGTMLQAIVVDEGIVKVRF